MVVSKGCEGERLVDEFNVGRTFQPMDDGELATVLVDLAGGTGEVRCMRQRCRNLAEQFDRNAIILQAEQVLKALAEGRPLPQVNR